MPIGDFTDQAEAYGRARPGYPSELVDYLAREAGVGPGDPVADFGAGTGIFTRILAERGFDVTAVEPNSEMSSKANVPGVRWVTGTFEDHPLADGSQAWAVAAQAFHWADPPVALPRLRRVLRPGGVFTVLWNNRARTESDVLQWTEECIRRHVPEFEEAYRDKSWEQILTSTNDFRFLSHHVVVHTVSMSTSRYLDLWRSHNRLNNIAGPARFAAFLADLNHHLVDHGIDEITVPYHCQTWSVQSTR